MHFWPAVIIQSVRYKTISIQLNVVRAFKTHWSRDAPTGLTSTTVRPVHNVFMCFVFI
jgi:hypothetical protein